MSIPNHPAADHEPADGRAQPGDVLGVERDGERTHLGDTREDEDERREDAEEDARDESSDDRLDDRSPL